MTNPGLEPGELRRLLHESATGYPDPPDGAGRMSRGRRRRQLLHRVGVAGLAGAVLVGAVVGLAVTLPRGSASPHPLGPTSSRNAEPSASPTSTPPPAATPRASAVAVMPTAVRLPVHALGLAGARFRGAGFGQVRPARIYLGGDPTGDLTHVLWHTWGGARAVGSGLSWYVAPNQPTAAGSEQPATVVAFDLGACQGQRVYRAVEWYFPQHGGYFDSTTYVNACTGRFVPAATWNGFR